MTPHSRKVMAKDLAKAYTRDSMQAFSKLAGVVGG
jgi:isocitrate lyase